MLITILKELFGENPFYLETLKKLKIEFMKIYFVFSIYYFRVKVRVSERLLGVGLGLKLGLGLVSPS